MKQMTLTSLIKMASPTHFVQLLMKVYPQYSEVIESKKSKLFDHTLTPRQKMNVIKTSICTEREYNDFIKQLSDLCQILETDLNEPILYTLLKKAHLDYPKDYSFQDLTIWLYLNHSQLWEDLLHRSFMRTPKCQAHACEIIPGVQSCWDYEAPRRIKEFEKVVPTVFEGMAVGEEAELIIDDIANGIYRAILLLSPRPRSVFTYERDAQNTFSIQPDRVARKIVLIYNEKLERLWVVGSIPERKTRIALAARWAESFLGGTCEKEAPPPTYQLETFKTLPLVFHNPHRCFKEMFITGITFAQKHNVRVKYKVFTSKTARLTREDIDCAMSIFNHQVEVHHVDLTVLMDAPLHGIDRFDIALSPKSISLGDAENCDDIRIMIEEVLGGLNVCA